MTLTKAQIAAIQNNWAAVANNMQGFGNALFLKYLTANPGDLAFFHKFESAGIGPHLHKNEAFQHQTMTVMQFLSKVVAHLTDLPTAEALLRERVHTHAPREITMHQFERLLDLLPRMLQELAGASGPTADAWRVAVACLMPCMRDEFTKV